MKKQRFTEEQIAHILAQVNSGLESIDEACRKYSVSRQTFYRWKKKFDGMGVMELKKLKVLEEENKKLKRLVADLSLDKHMLQEILEKKF